MRTESDVVLETEGVRKEFGGIVALDGANLQVRDGEVVGIIGPNGAGKSTLFNCIMGVYSPDGGTVSLRGTELTTRRTFEIINLGVSRTFQIPEIFAELTVRENMLVSAGHDDERILPTAVRSPDESVEKRVNDLLEFVDIEHLADEPASDLSTGQQKLLNLAATLVSEPEIVLLDEPTAGVNPKLVDDIVEAIVELNDGGTTFLVIEHNMNVITRLSDHLYVLTNGTNLTDGKPDEVLDDPRVLEAYFGE